MDNAGDAAVIGILSVAHVRDISAVADRRWREVDFFAVSGNASALFSAPEACVALVVFVCAGTISINKVELEVVWVDAALLWDLAHVVD